MMEMGALYKTIKSKQQFKTKIYKKNMNKAYEKYKNSSTLKLEVEADVVLEQKSLKISQIWAPGLLYFPVIKFQSTEPIYTTESFM